MTSAELDLTGVVIEQGEKVDETHERDESSEQLTFSEDDHVKTLLPKPAKPFKGKLQITSSIF